MPRRAGLRPRRRAPDLRELPAPLPGRGRHSRDAGRGSRAVRTRLIRRPSLLYAVALALGVPSPGAAAPQHAAPPVIIEAVTATGYRARVPVGEATVVRGRVFGFDLAEIRIPDGTEATPWGEPALPTRTVLLRVPWGTVPSVRGTIRGVRSLGVLEPAPIPRILTEDWARRRVSARALIEALAGPSYRALGGIRQAPVATRAVPMAMGGTRYVAVTIAPVLWNPVTREASVAEEVVLDVSWDRSVAQVGPAGSDEGGPRYTPRPRGAGARAPGVGLTRVASAAIGPLRVDLSRPWVRLTVARPGLYQVTAANLAAAGVVPGSIDPATFRLFRANPGDLPESTDVDAGPDSLRECAIEVTGGGDGSFDAADVLNFYSTGETGFGYDLRAGGGTEYEETQRTDTQPLWLTWGSGIGAGPPRRMAVRDASPVTGTSPLLTSVTHRAHFEENRVFEPNLFQAPLRWERWFMSLIQSVQQTTRRRFATVLPGALPGGAMALRVRMWGFGSNPGTTLPDHFARIYWDRALVDTDSSNFSTPRELAATGLPTNGPRDTLEIEIPFRSADDDT